MGEQQPFKRRHGCQPPLHAFQASVAGCNSQAQRVKGTVDGLGDGHKTQAPTAHALLQITALVVWCVLVSGCYALVIPVLGGGGPQIGVAVAFTAAVLAVAGAYLAVRFVGSSVHAKLS